MTVLKNIVRFVGLVVAVPVALPHGLHIDNGTLVPVTPKDVRPNTGGYVITVDTINVTVTRTAAGVANVDVYVEFWHSIEDALPAGGLAGLAPFILDPGSSSGGAVASVTAGDGLINSGTPANVILDVVANADGSIAVGANDVGVGVLATDAQHGLRGGGAQHALVVPAGAAGFMSGADKSKLDGITPGAAVASVTAGDGLINSGTATNPILDVVANADGSIVVGANDVGVGVLATDAQHGVRGGGTQHAVATIAVAGFMSAADKTKLDTIGANAGSAVLGFGNASIAAGADTRFLDTWYNQATAPTVATPTIVVPRAGTLANLFVRHNVAAGNGNSVVYTVLVNGVATAITVTLATAAVGQASDLVNTAVVAQGDRITLRAVKALAIGSGTQEVTAFMELRG